MDGKAGVGGRGGPSLRAAAALGGALWGLGGYLLLWGHTPLVIHRSFVVSVPGTVLLFPIRAVLWGIRVVEERAGYPFQFAQRSAWIGLVGAVIGASISTGAFALVRGALRRMRRVRATG